MSSRSYVQFQRRFSGDFLNQPVALADLFNCHLLTFAGLCNE